MKKTLPLVVGNRCQGVAGNQVGMNESIFTARLGNMWVTCLNPTIIDKACKDRHKLGAILNFIGLNEGIDEWDIYDNVIGNVSMEIKNYNKLIK